MSVLDTWENIPKSMRDADQWLCFIFQDRGTGRLGKPPVSPKTRKIVDKTDETKWTSFNRALATYQASDYDGGNIEGVGFMFDNGFIAIDLDDCFDEDDKITPVAQDILDHFSGAYVEYSPSGNGLHLFVRGVKPNNRTKDTESGIEVYSGKNFVTVTGNMLEDSGEDCYLMQEEVNWLFETYLPEKNIKGTDYTEIEADHGDRSPDEWLDLGLEKDEKLNELYNNDDHSGDESNIDMSLITKLSFWLNRDYDAIYEAFIESPWFETKDTKHKNKVLNRADYIENTINNAINMTINTAQESDDKFKRRVKVKLRPVAEVGGDVTSFVDDRFLEDLTDQGVATLVAEAYSDVLAYTEQFGWCWFNGRRWELSARLAAQKCVMDVLDILLEEAHNWVGEAKEEVKEQEADGDLAKKILAEPMKLLKYVMNARKISSIKSIIAILQPELEVDPKEFDKHEWLLNTPLCVIDLRTGERLSHKAEYMCTGMTNVTPDDSGTSELWNRTLKETFGSDELIDFVQLHMGSALIGKVFQENLLMANGAGSNGKSTFFGAIQHVMGDYATSVDPTLLMSSKQSDQQVGMAMLFGKRLAIAQESDEGSSMNGAMLKRLVSTDVMVAKKLYHDPFNFIPTHTLILSTNHLPRVKSNDKGTWRRIEVLPFNSTIEQTKMITDYMGMLTKECGGQILQWCVDGAVKFYEAGCTIVDKPKEVMAAHEEYREQEDWLKRFINDCIRDTESNSGDVYLTHEEVYSVFKAWCKRNYEYKRSSIALSKALVAEGWNKRSRVWDAELDRLVTVWDNKMLIKGITKNNIVKLKDVS